MKQLLVLLVMGLLAVACKKKEVPPEVDSLDEQQAPTAKSGVPRCPSGEDPKLSTGYPEGMTLVVCGFSTQSEFVVYGINPQGAFTSPLVSLGAVEQGAVQVRGGNFLVTNKVSYRNAWVPAFSREITCTSSACKTGAERCLFRGKKNKVDAKAVAEFNRYVSGPLKNKYIDDRLVTRAGDAALSGDKKLQAFFLKRPTLLKIDGASAEEFHEISDWITKFKKLKCL